MARTVRKQEGVNEQFTDISTIVRPFTALAGAIVCTGTDDGPQTHSLHASILACKDNQVQTQKGDIWFFILTLWSELGRQTVFPLCIWQHEL